MPSITKYAVNSTLGKGANFKPLNQIVEEQTYESFYRLASLQYANDSSVLIVPEGTTTIPEDAYRISIASILILPLSVKVIKAKAFQSVQFNQIFLPPRLEKVENNVFTSSAIEIIVLPARLKNIGNSAFACANLKTVIFKGTPQEISDSAFSNAGSRSGSVTFNVPWADGEISNQPWGAINATINYDSEV